MTPKSRNHRQPGRPAPAAGRNGPRPSGNPADQTVPDSVRNIDLPVGVHPAEGGRWRRFKEGLIGAPRNLWDRSLFRHVALVPLLAWVGMGADGLTSSCYGPEEAFRVLGTHTYLAPLIGLATALTIFIIATSYNGIIENFPHGGGGYVVASKLLGPIPGLVSGCALIVDYMLTITVSVTAGGSALFSMLPLGMQGMKMPVDIAVIGLLVVLNLRGVRESVSAIAPIFFVFVVSHVLLLAGVFWMHPQGLLGAASEVTDGWGAGIGTLGLGGVVVLFIKSYSMGAGTYTGLEAVSNGLSILREPRVKNGKQTMTYMAISLAALSLGLLVAYLLLNVRSVPGQTLNAVLARGVFTGWLGAHSPWATALLWLVLLSEAGLLMVAAQTGFIGGPRVLANLAVDSWLPKRFSALSSRLTVQNGVALFGGGAILVLLYAGGNIETLIIMYSINVFITFTLSHVAMLRLWWRRHGTAGRFRNLMVYLVGLALCASILVIMLYEKFTLGGWVTVLVTGILCLLCWWTHGYYQKVRMRVRRLDEQLTAIGAKKKTVTSEPDPSQPTAILLVENYGGVGLHSLYTIFFKHFPGYFKNVVFVSVGVVNSGNFKGIEALKDLQQHVMDDMERYVDLARNLGIPADFRMTVDTEVVQPAVDLCVKTAREFRRSMVFGNKLVFQKPSWHQRYLHDETANAIQARLQWEGIPMTVMPVRLFS